MAIKIVLPDDPLRRSVERHVSDIFLSVYGAAIRSFPEIMIAELLEGGGIACAAGIRTAGDGFYSEHYFGMPLQDVIAGVDGRPVDRRRIVEVANLAAGHCGAAAPLIDAIIAFSAGMGAGWAVFTITPRLLSLLKRLGYSIVLLGPADRAQVPNPEDWGSYYDCGPVVAAMRKPASGRACRFHPSQVAMPAPAATRHV